MQNSIFTMPTLPTELITEILSRLPVKSLLQFRSVSKSWLALISSPQFVKTHLTVSAKNKDYTHHRVVLTEVRNFYSSRNGQYILRDCSLTSLRNDSVVDAFDLDHPMNNPQQNVSFVGSVNGLICLASKDNDLVIWNPSIRLFKQLPDSHFDSPTDVRYGFGYDESTDDYKVVGVLRMVGFPILDHVKVKIYSLKSNSWKRTDDIPDGVQLSNTCKFVNRKLHWANNVIGPFNKGWIITSIDLADEKWGKVEQPSYGGGSFTLKLEVLGSDLSVLCNYTTSHADLWVMREYGVKESWTKMYTIKYPGYLYPGYLYSLFNSQTLCMSNKGDVLVVPGSTIMVHNPEDEPIKYPEVTKFGFCVAVNIYIESLVRAPLYGTNKAQNKIEGRRRR